MNISTLVIEVTRRCNMTCNHCLRGEAQNMNLKPEFVESLLSQVDEIGSVSFSGGEPSLAVGVINHFLETAKRKKVEIGNFYIATNGLDITEDFILACIRLYAYCYEKGHCAVQVSNDIFHQDENSYDTELLDSLSFFGRKWDKEGFDFERGKSLLSEGRGKENFTASRNVLVHSITSKDDFNDGEIYLNCKGNIVSGCDWSYDSQDKDKMILCQVDHLKEFYELLVDE